VAELTLTLLPPRRAPVVAVETGGALPSDRLAAALVETLAPPPAPVVRAPPWVRVSVVGVAAEGGTGGELVGRVGLGR